MKYLILGIVIFTSITAAGIATFLIVETITATQAQEALIKMNKELDKKIQKEQEKQKIETAQRQQQQQQFNRKQQQIRERQEIEAEKNRNAQKINTETCQYWERNQDGTSQARAYRQMACDKIGRHYPL